MLQRSFVAFEGLFLSMSSKLPLALKRLADDIDDRGVEHDHS